MRRLVLLPLVMFVFACTDSVPVQPEPDAVSPAPLFSAHSKGAVVYRGDWGCGVIDGEGHWFPPNWPDDALFCGTEVATYGENMNASLTVQASGVPNTTGKTVHWGPYNPGQDWAASYPDLTGPPYPCFVLGTERELNNPLFTVHWKAWVTPSGEATLSCQYSKKWEFNCEDYGNCATPSSDTEPPVITDLQPPDGTPHFTWNPDLGVEYSGGPPDPTRLCPSTDDTLCESLMFEAVDLGTGVEDGSCGVGCADDDGDGNLIDVLILDSPGDVYNGASLLTNNAGLGPDMFQAFFCGDNFAPGNGGALCDGSDDGSYTVRILASDKAQPENNVATLDYSFVLDVTPPVIGFGGITGLNASNAATVEFVLDASVVDRNGDGTAVTSAIVQITGITGGGDCSLGAEDLVTEAQVQVTPEGGNDDATGNTVIADVTAEVQANNGDFDLPFTATNLGAGDYTYCFEIVADDGAERKNGSYDGLTVSAVAGKDFLWQ